METGAGIFWSVLWFVLRFGVPIVLTILVVYFFKRLDRRWQEQAEAVRAQAVADGVVPVVKCWLLNDCPEELVADCPAHQNQGKPCWQHFRTKDGCLKEDCLDCGVFKGAPVPITGD